MQGSEKWLYVFLAATYLNRIGGAALATIFGPSQPYIADRLGVDIDTVNWLWTVSGMSAFLGFLASSFTFKQYITQKTHKMLVFAVTNCVFGAFIFFFASIRSFPVIVICAMTMHFINSYGSAGEGGMLVYTMGPDRSRPWIMAMHALVGVGFAVGPFIVGRYFPPAADDADDKSQYRVCMSSEEKLAADNSTSSSSDAQVDIEAPWMELGAMTGLLGLVFLVPMFLPWKMPVHQDFAMELESKRDGQKRKVFPATPYKWLTLAIIVVYYMTICGNERIFQSMQFTFGLCGPLSLSPRDAVFIDKMYNIGFTLGRLVGIGATFFLRPQVMVIAATTAVVASSAGIAAFASFNRDLYYALTFVFGFSISWQYGSMYSWLAKHMDLVVSHFIKYLIY